MLPTLQLIAAGVPDSSIVVHQVSSVRSIAVGTG